MSTFRRTRAFYHRARVKRLERAMLVAHEKLLAAEAGVRRIRYELEVAYDEAEDICEYEYIPHAEPDEFDAEQGLDNVVEFRPK